MIDRVEKLERQMAELASEVEALKAQVEELRVKAEENLAGWQRTQADFENYRRRVGGIQRFL